MKRNCKSQCAPFKGRLDYIPSEKYVLLERFFTPYQTGCAVLGDRIAVIAPHPDDEVFGCGASLCKWVEQGKAVRVFVLTQGVLRHEFDDRPEAQTKRQTKVEQRAQESRNAATVLGLPAPIFLAGQDGELWDSSDIELALQDQLQAWSPSTIVAPSIWEMHRDHRAAAEMSLRLASQLASVKQVTLYEVGVPLKPDVLEDVSVYQARKWQAMQCFASQLAGQHYAHQIAGLNTYRTYTLGMDVTYAEAFHCIPRERLALYTEAQAPEQLSLILRQAEQCALKYTNQTQQRQQELEQRQQELKQLRAEREQIYSSRSWRITKPLRWLCRKLSW